jgi:hypothetical protein
MAITTTGMMAMALAATVASGAYGLKQQNDAMHERHKMQNQADAEKQALKDEQAAIEGKAQQEYIDKLNKRQRSGRESTIATGPQGLLASAPIAKASLSGKSLLG